jgi:hypothetical protein
MPIVVFRRRLMQVGALSFALRRLSNEGRAPAACHTHSCSRCEYPCGPGQPFHGWQARRKRLGDRPAADRRDDLTASQSP